MSAGFLRDARGITKRFRDIAVQKPSSYVVDDFNGSAMKSAVNLVRKNGALETVKPPEKVGRVTPPQSGGAVSARCSNGSSELMKIGTSLYAKKSNGEIVSVCENGLTEGQSLIFRLNGNFYVTNNKKIYKVTDALVFSEVEFTVPLVYDIEGNVDADAEMIAEPNALCDYVDIRYTINSETSSLYIPKGIRIDSVESIKKGNSTYGGTYSVYSDVRTGTQHISLGTSAVGTITARVKLASAAYDGSVTLADFANVRRALFNTRFAVKYDDPSENYGVVLGTCGTTYKKFYVVGISDISYVTRNDAASCYIDETASAMAEYSDGALVFTATRILFVKTSFRGAISSGTTFETKVIKRDFGCDMPHSVVGFSDMIIFADSKNGIYCINKFGYSEKDGSCRVSDPIDDEFFSHEKSEFEAATAICTKDAYYISIGENVYAWRYSDMFPSSPTESAERREKYNWSRLDVIGACDFACARGSDVYAIMRDTGDVCVYHGAKRGEDGDTIYSEAKTVLFDFGRANEKMLSRATLTLERCGDVNVKFIYDGAVSNAEYTLKKVDVDAPCSVTIRPERRRFRGVGMRISSYSPMKIMRADFLYENVT